MTTGSVLWSGFEKGHLSCHLVIVGLNASHEIEVEVYISSHHLAYMHSRYLELVCDYSLKIVLVLLI